MVVIKCPIDGCHFQTEDLPVEIITKLLELHVIQHQQTQITRSTSMTVPKLTRPLIDIGVNQEAWLTFTRRWDRRGSGIDDSAAAIQLFQCTSEQLGDLLLKSDPKVTLRTEAQVLALMESIAVIKVSLAVTRSELLRIRQDNDEAFRRYATRVRGKAEICQFARKVTCECGKTIPCEYTEEVIKDVMLAGINDVDIRREILGTEDIHSKSVNEIVTLVESREMGRNATEPHKSTVSAVSTFKQRLKQPQLDKEKVKMIPCPQCNKAFSPYRKLRSGWNTKPFKLCLSCWREKPKQQNSVEQYEDSSDDSLEQEVFITSQISAVESSQPIVLNHIIMSRNCLSIIETKSRDHPQVSFELSFVR